MSIVPVGFNRKATMASCPVQLAAFGPTIGVQIGFDPNYDGKNPAAVPAIPSDMRNALIDTGASHSSIDEKLAKQLGLPVVDKKPISGVHGSQEVEICSGQIYLPYFAFTIYGLFALVKLQEGGQQHHALLGRTLLQGFVFVYDGVEGYVRLMR
jgi:hypothetical protein